MDAGIKEKVSGNDGEKNDVKGDRELVLVRRAQRTRVPVAFLVQGPCEPDDSYVTECFTCNPEATMSTANGMGDRKPGSRGFRAGQTGFSAARTTDAEENPDDFVLPDFYWVLRPVNPAHVLDDSKAGSGGSRARQPRDRS